MDIATSLFFTLLRSGLWGTEPVPPRLPESGDTSPELEVWKKTFRLAMEQTVVGLITDGASSCPAGYVPKDVSIRLMSALVGIEKRNASINALIARIIPLFEEAGVPVILVKGQAVAQCYSRPQGRMSGDIDLVMRPQDYEAAKAVLSGIADRVDGEGRDKLHFGAMIGDVEVELHGTVHTSLGSRINAVLDSAQESLFEPGGCRHLDVNGVQVRIPSIDFDALFIFVHLLQHFYCGGLGLRQLCDWARVLHTHCGQIDRELLTSRLRQMGIVSEWQAFLSFLVKYLALPKEEAPMYERSAEGKADKLWRFMEKVGNFGKNRKRRNRGKDPYVIRKIGSFLLNSGDFLRHATIFPLDSVKFFLKYFTTGTRAVMRGE